MRRWGILLKWIVGSDRDRRCHEILRWQIFKVIVQMENVLLWNLWRTSDLLDGEDVGLLVNAQDVIVELLDNLMLETVVLGQLMSVLVFI